MLGSQKIKYIYNAYKEKKTHEKSEVRAAGQEEEKGGGWNGERDGRERAWEYDEML